MTKKKTEKTEKPAEESQQSALVVETHQSRLMGDEQSPTAVVIVDEQQRWIENIGWRLVRWLTEEENPLEYAKVLSDYLEAGCPAEFAIQLTENWLIDKTLWNIIECPTCKGTGYINSNDCYGCGSRGVIAT